MAERFHALPPLPAEEEVLPLAQRAAYRRVLAVLKAQRLPFLVVGQIGLSLHLGRLVDEGKLEIAVRPVDREAVLGAMESAGFRVENADHGHEAEVSYGDYVVKIAWGLPAPLTGRLDDAWFTHAERAHFVDLRVWIAPIEELLWMRLATLAADRLPDPVVEDLLLGHGRALDWRRLQERTIGLEGLLLAEIFLLYHRQPSAARQALPAWVLGCLLDRLNAAASTSVTQPTG
jgi:hypothetical protein